MNEFGEPKAPSRVEIRIARPSTGSSMEIFVPVDQDYDDLMRQFPGWDFVGVTGR